MSYLLKDLKIKKMKKLYFLKINLLIKNDRIKKKNIVILYNK